MIVRKGDRGPQVKQIQLALKRQGYWPYKVLSTYFGSLTDSAVRKYQKDNDLVVDGKVGKDTLELLGIVIEPTTQYDEKYKDVIIEGSVFPDKPIKTYKITLNPEMLNEYIPALNKVMEGEPRGFRLLLAAMAYKEGFRKGTRSYRYNNPGNIGNTDMGKNKGYKTLEDGILRQKEFILDIINNKNKNFPIGKTKIIKPYFSPEIAKHTKLYGMSPYVPGYKFVFTGQLDQFVKIYATGSRASNNYISTIKSFFKQHGININAESKIQDIIKIE